MAIFDGNLPYTNFHELNLDWVIKCVKEIRDKTDNIDESVAEARNSADIATEKANEISEYADEIEYLSNNMDYYVVNVSDTQATIQEYLSKETAKTIEFKDGTYNFTQTLYLNANTVLLLNNAVLNFEIPSVLEDYTKSHGFFNFLPDETPLAYNGKGNISVIGGTIYGGNFSLCHAKNINFKNVIFKNCKNDHVIELCAINGCTIENCVFEGITTTTNFKEYVQLDIARREDFPHFTEPTNITYDLTHCKNIYFKGDYFIKPDDINYHFYSGIGNHSYYPGMYHENIIINDCYFNNTENYSISLSNINHLQIFKSFFATDTTITGTHILLNNINKNVLIFENILSGNKQAFDNDSAGINLLSIKNNIFLNNTFSETLNNSVLRCFNTELLEIKNNLFYDFSQSCIRTLGNNTYKAVIENNAFITSNTIQENGSVIKPYMGTSYITNNIFDINAFDSNVDKIITLSGDAYMYHIANNVYNTYLITEDKLLSTGTYNGQIDIKNQAVLAYTGSITSGNITLPIAYSNFNTLKLTLGTGANTQNATLYSWDNRRMLDARTYHIPVESNYVILTLNDSGTLTYSDNSTGLALRGIWLINEP